METVERHITPPNLPAKISEIVVISGFLGSGKTTLLKRFLDWEFSLGNVPSVIMSEFGDFDVDGAVISDERLQVKAITGGCICCSNKDELAETISSMTANDPGRRIYIETTGLADPAGVIAAITPVIGSEIAAIRKVLVVYDASRHGQFGRDQLIVEKQIMTADRILVNKCDLATEGLEALATDISSINPAATVIQTVSCDMDLEEAIRGTTACYASGRVEEATADTYKSFAFQLDTRLHRRPFENWLSSLPDPVIRAKGFARFEKENGIFQIQATPNRYEITPFRTIQWMDASLVVIAHPMRPDDLLPGLQECVPTNADSQQS